jgi:uncharacterized protein
MKGWLNHLKLIDANVFVYMVGSPNPYREPCRRILGDVFRGVLAATVDTELFQEIMHVYRRRGQPQQGVDLVRRLLLLFPAPVSITGGVIATAADILADNPHIQVRDAVHAAIVLEHRFEGIISVDRGFDTIPGVTRFDPLQLENQA